MSCISVEHSWWERDPHAGGTAILEAVDRTRRKITFHAPPFYLLVDSCCTPLLEYHMHPAMCDTAGGVPQHLLHKMLPITMISKYAESGLKMMM